MSDSDLAAEIYRTAHVTGEFTLRSGRTADEYFDKFLFEADPVLLRRIATRLADLLPPAGEFDGLAGLELGGIPIATVLSQVTGRQAFFVRKKPKEYGTQRLAEGGEIDGRRLVIVEDVVTSAGQILESTKELRSRGATVEVVLCVIDRESDGASNLRAEGLELRSLYRMSDLVAGHSRSHSRSHDGGRNH